ncbi:MAG: Amidohydrolase [Candidatus Hydrogenedentes bacterium ADurb.Bin101]|nr:MAG: Amidohydrolase [Candidatus Hydrogenedentes bacterium ADurb.Bin101]
MVNRRAFLKEAGSFSAAFMGMSHAHGGFTADEAVLSFPVVDTHVHFWDTARLRYPWLENSALLNRPYLPQDYDEAIGSVKVGKIVFVEAACADDQTQAEVDWVTALAKDEPRIQGIVANVPLEQGETVLPRLEALAVNPLVKGIRRFFSSQTEVPLGLHPGLVKGVQCLERFGLRFDLGLQRGQVPVATELVRQCPNVRFMLNHIGVPDIKNNALDPWRQEIRALAELPNVFCKMSGAATLADHASWTPEELQPALEHVINCFGFERAAFGSDWPVMLSATAYPRWISAAAWAIQGCSETEKCRLFRDTAVEFYGLPPVLQA